MGNVLEDYGIIISTLIAVHTAPMQFSSTFFPSRHYQKTQQDEKKTKRFSLYFYFMCSSEEIEVTHPAKRIKWLLARREYKKGLAFSRGSGILLDAFSFAFLPEKNTISQHNSKLLTFASPPSRAATQK